MDNAPRNGDTVEEEDEEQRHLRAVREALRPPPIPGVEDWGIPPAPEGEVDPEILVSPPSSKFQHISDPIPPAKTLDFPLAQTLCRT